VALQCRRSAVDTPAVWQGRGPCGRQGQVHRGLLGHSEMLLVHVRKLCDLWGSQDQPIPHRLDITVIQNHVITTNEQLLQQETASLLPGQPLTMLQALSWQPLTLYKGLCLLALEKFALTAMTISDYWKCVYASGATVTAQKLLSLQQKVVIFDSSNLHLKLHTRRN